MKAGNWIAVFALLLLAVSPVFVSGASNPYLEKLLAKGSSLTYEIIHRTRSGEEKAYYTVTVKDVFLGSQGLMYTLEISYFGTRTVRDQTTLPEYNLLQVIPLPAGLRVDDIRSKGYGTIYMPIPVFELIPRVDPAKPYAYATIRMKLVSITTYILNLTRVAYRVRALRLHTTYKGYNTTAFLEEKTGLLLRISFVNPKTRSLEYEVKLVFASNIEAIIEEQTVQPSTNWSNLIPLIIVVTIIVISIIMLIIAIRKVSRFIR